MLLRGRSHTFPVRLLVGVVEVVPLVRRVQLVHVDVQVVWRLPEVVLALVQRQADPRGGELFTVTWTPLQGQRGGRGYKRRTNRMKAGKNSDLETCLSGFVELTRSDVPPLRVHLAVWCQVHPRRT